MSEWDCLVIWKLKNTGYDLVNQNIGLVKQLACSLSSFTHLKGPAHDAICREKHTNVRVQFSCKLNLPRVFFFRAASCDLIGQQFFF